MILRQQVEFARDIQKLCTEKKFSYIDAVVYWCEQNNVDVEYAGLLCKKDPIIKQRITTEAENLNIIKTETAKLPL
jgi:hypothetical protein